MVKNRKDSKGHVLRKGEQERLDGRYHYTYIDAAGKKSYVYAKNLNELRRLEKEIARDLEDGINNADSKITLNQLFLMQKELKQNLRKTTIKNYELMWRSNIEKSAIGKKKISELKKMHIMGFYNDCVKSGLKKNTIKFLHDMIFSALELAVDSDFIRKNPAKGAMQLVKKDAEEKIPLTMHEVQEIIQFCAQSRTYSAYIPFITIAIGTCLRCGEITGLTWNDINMRQRKISINHQLIYKNYGEGCKFYISEPKTDAGIRVIPMSQAVYQAFIDIKEQNMLLGRRSKVEIDGCCNFVFVSKNGNPFAVNAVNNFLYNIERAYNKRHPEMAIPHLSAHILRHTGCTLLASSGMDVKALQNIMGHSDASITMNIYNHNSFERTEKEIHRLDDVINF